MSLLGGSCFAAQACSFPFSANPKIQIIKKYDRFPQGVASADPQLDGVVLWTRCQPQNSELTEVSLTVEISLSEGFSDLILQHSIIAKHSSDYTVRFFASGLTSDTQYFYRFYTEKLEGSRVGRTRTAPDIASNREVNFAWASCQDYEAGFYNGWKKLLSDDARGSKEKQLDFIIHVGDFIYETIQAQFKDSDSKAAWGEDNYLKHRGGTSRKIPTLPSGGAPGKFGGIAAVDIGDFRHLYKEYLKDTYLQEARARWPFICIWDDHEFTDNAWQSHTGQIANQKGRLAANQAWFEYIPALLTIENSLPAKLVNPGFDKIAVENTPFGMDEDIRAEDEPNNQKVITSLKVYRQIQYGANLNLIITDNRLYRSDHLIPEAWAKKYFATNKLYKTKELFDSLDGPNQDEIISHNGVKVPNPRIGEPFASILGVRQKAWFKDVLSASDTTWKIWVNSVPLTPIKFRQDRDTENREFVTIHSDDAWDGYPTEKREIMSYIRDNSISNVVSLSGDYHAHLASPDVGNEANSVIAEFVVTALSSVSLYRVLRLITSKKTNLRDHIIGSLEGDNVKLDKYLMEGEKLNPNISYADTNSTGYGLVTLNSSEMVVKLISIESPLIDYAKSKVPIKRVAEFKIPST